MTGAATRHTATRQGGDAATRRRGNAATRQHGNPTTRRRDDAAATRQRGDAATHALDGRAGATHNRRVLLRALDAATAEQVWELLPAHVRPGAATDVPAEQALGLVLARDVPLAHDFPPFDRAVMDGYAVRCAEFAGGGSTGGAVRLRRLGLVRAGAGDSQQIAAGGCLRINTGAPLPLGADAVVVVEHARETDDGYVELHDTPQPGQHIDRRGSLMRAGDTVVRAGTRIDAGGLAAIVAAGAQRVAVFQRPRVALLSTGDELVETGRPLGHGQIHDSNSVGIARLIERAGGEPVALGRCPDEPAALEAALRGGLEHTMLCVIGGMSKGSHDLVPGALERLGVEWLVRSLNLKPGKPTRIGRGPGGAWVVGLPGNPVSAAVCFLLFARPMLDGLRGLGASRPPVLRGRLEADLPPVGNRPMFQPAQWAAGPAGESLILPLAWRGSGDPFGLAGANALIQRAAEAPAALRGEAVAFLPIDMPR